MAALEEELSKDSFLRVSRSAILNLGKVVELQTLTGISHVAVLTSGEKVPFTRPLREVEDRLRRA
jgi:two-component system LytT family response regulator